MCACNNSIHIYIVFLFMKLFRMYVYADLMPLCAAAGLLLVARL